MKRVYILEHLDCAHCAALIEEQVGKLEGVSKATLNFLTTKLIVECEDGKEKEIEKEIKKIVKKLEPLVEVVLKS